MSSNASVTVVPRKKGLILDKSPQIPGVIPEAVDIPSTNKMFVPHRPGETRILRNMGYKVPSPIHHHYDWNGGTPFQAQKTTAAMLVCEPRAFVLSGMGTGKTRSVLFAYDYLRKQGLVRNMLVVAPLSTLNFTWAREVFFNFPDYRVGVVHGRNRREKILTDDRFDIHVINHDGVKVMENELIKKKFDIIVIDEVAVFRNARSQRHKSMARVAKNYKYLWGLTGTPTPKDPTDAYGIIKLITPGNREVTSFSRFREKLMYKITQFKWVPKPGAQEEVFRLMQPGVRFTMDECIDMPPTVYSEREVKLSTKQKQCYEELRKYATTKTDNGNQVRAVNEAVLINKLLQVSSGCVYDSEKNSTLLDPEDRLKITEEVVFENDSKSIVFCPFIPLVGMVANYLESKGCKVWQISGATPVNTRSKIFSEFQDNAKGAAPEVLVAHPATMSHGLTLTAASLVLWYAPVDNLETYQQANARIARPGQVSHKVQVMHLVSSPADRRIYRRLQSKEQVQGSLLELFDD